MPTSWAVQTVRSAEVTTVPSCRAKPSRHTSSSRVCSRESCIGRRKSYAVGVTPLRARRRPRAPRCTEDGSSRGCGGVTPTRIGPVRPDLRTSGRRVSGRRAPLLGDELGEVHLQHVTVVVVVELLLELALQLLALPRLGQLGPVDPAEEVD